MCRTGGRRCEQHWQESKRDLYNAKRRAIRNKERSAQARATGDTTKADMYDALAAKATSEVAVAAKPAWAESSFTTPAGDTYYTQTNGRSILMGTANTEVVGSIMWDSDGLVSDVTVREPFQGQGVDAELVRLGTQKEPRLRHPEGTARCPDCGQFTGDNHTCATPTESVNADLEYQLTHRAPVGDSDDDGSVGSLDNLDHIYPPDIYDNPRMYPGWDTETVQQLATARGNPDAMITVYRAVPEGVTVINRGDWVTLSREYADTHNRSHLNSSGIILETQVPASRIWSDANSLAEFGYGGDTLTLGDTTEQQRCPDCGEYMADDHSCTQSNQGDQGDGAALSRSVVRDADGNLAPMWHGSSTDFDTFDPEFTGTGNDSWGSGFYFTDDHDRARGYGDHVKEVFLDITNPIRVNGKDSSSLDDDFRFTAEQSAAILRNHPDLYNQPDDDDMNPLGDYTPQFWDKEQWSRPELDAMITTMARENFNDVPWSYVESMFEGGKTDLFRRAVRDITGHDGVVTSFGDEGTHWIAWFPEQIHTTNPTSGDTSGDTTATKCPDCGQFAGPDHTCAPRHPLASAPDSPDQFTYVRNPEPSTTYSTGNDYGQGTEPSGRYMSRSAGFTPDGWETGEVTFANPLRMEFGGTYGEPDNWKNRLSAHYDGKTGYALSRALRGDGYDAIITHDEYGESEVVDLTGVPEPRSARKKRAAAGWDQTTTHAPGEAMYYGDHIGAKYGVELSLSGGSEPDSYVTLQKIEVPQDKRGQGLASKVMEEFLAEADRNGWSVALSPDNTWGSSVTRLRKFYAGFGFVNNKGRAKDYRTRETMHRRAQGS